MAWRWFCLARDERHAQSVPLKELRPELAPVIGAERFLVEIKTTIDLQHRHHLSRHDSGSGGESLHDSRDATPYHATHFLRMYDVSRDGRFLMFKYEASGPRTDVVIIRNWVQQVKRQLGQSRD